MGFHVPQADDLPPEPGAEGRIDFPVTFDLKVIMNMAGTLEDNRSRLQGILDALGIPFAEWRTRFSSNRNYVSFSVTITLSDRALMDRLYGELKKDAAVRFAF